MFNERGIKEAFDRVKNDIFSLGNELSQIKLELLDLKQQLVQFNALIEEFRTTQILQNNAFSTPTQIPTDIPQIPTHSASPTDNPTVPCEVRGLKYPNLDISTGNRGVPTDRQTNQQTDNPTDKSLSQQIKSAEEILNSLDNLKKEIRLKFKTITNQEMLVFSTIYQLEQAYPEGVEYLQIAQKLRLSESSIRDYTQKLISKGIPILKQKLNNKKILLKISSELKKIASLDTLIQLREL